jgi:signal transduction histidine kinase
VHARACGGAADREALDVALRQLALVEEKLQCFLQLGRNDSPRPQPCSLPGLVDEAVALLRPRCRHLHIELRWQPPEMPLVVLGDGHQLGHLLMNVLGNAVEAAGPNGWVEVRLAAPGDGTVRRAVDGGPPPDAACAVVEVLDSGAGPPPEVAERVFEEFVTSKPEGVGLGLAVARQVAEAHGGRIGWGRVNGHTCFQIWLPVVQTPHEPAEGPTCRGDRPAAPAGSPR